MDFLLNRLPRGDKEIALSELSRVLRPGKRVQIIDFDYNIELIRKYLGDSYGGFSQVSFQEDVIDEDDLKRSDSLKHVLNGPTAFQKISFSFPPKPYRSDPLWSLPRCDEYGRPVNETGELVAFRETYYD